MSYLLLKNKEKGEQSNMLKREIKLPVFSYNGEHYVRTYDFCRFVDIKQPFQFTKNIKDWKPDSVIKGRETDGFRPLTDGIRTTYINVEDLTVYIEVMKKTRLISYNTKYMQQVQNEFNRYYG